MPLYMALKNEANGSYRVAAQAEERAEVMKTLKDAEHGEYLLVKALAPIEVGPPKREPTTVVRAGGTYSPRKGNTASVGGPE